MHPTPYLFFNGNCAEAMAAYGAIFGTEPGPMMRAGDMPDVPVPDDRRDWIAHTDLKIGDGMLMASDNIFGQSDAMAGASVLLSYPTADEARAIFDKLAAGGEVTMAFEPTFWSAGFGTCTDRFGIRWMVGTDGEPPESH
ncbi:MAG: VOC family protein [Paracoccaceae bacterium]|nr:VOC family protein [Paracoccaceae bacterium]